MVQKRLSGELTGWDPDTRILHVRFRKWWETSRYTEASATFGLDPYAIVTSAYRGTLRLSELKAGQRVTLTYVTGTGGHPIAKVLVVSSSRGAMKKQVVAPE